MFEFYKGVMDLPDLEFEDFDPELLGYVGGISNYITKDGVFNQDFNIYSKLPNEEELQDAKDTKGKKSTKAEAP